MERLRATIDLYVYLDENTTKEEALSLVNEAIDHINGGIIPPVEGVEASEIIQYEVYDTEEEI